jgi:shikimate dehydrogenase
VKPVSAATRLAGVIGHPVSHSRSPALHNAAYRALGLDAIYLAFAVAPGQVRAALAGARALGMLGLNVTVPHKRAALEACDEVDDEARMVGAVNTVVVRGDRLVGSNTDVLGFRASLLAGLAGRKAKHALVLGAGGAARAVVVALAGMGISSSVVSRDVERGSDLLGLGAFEAMPWESASLRRAVAESDLIIDATSAGLSAEAERAVPAPVPIDAIAAGSLVVSLVYNREPALLAGARARGLATLDGAGMLVHQAARAFELMTGREAPLDAMWAAMSADGARG